MLMMLGAKRHNQQAVNNADVSKLSMSSSCSAASLYRRLSLTFNPTVIIIVSISVNVTLLYARSQDSRSPGHLPADSKPFNPETLKPHATLQTLSNPNKPTPPSFSRDRRPHRSQCRELHLPARILGFGAYCGLLQILL